jgi:soluble P-type ATPase
VSAQSKYSYNRIAMVGDGATDMEARQPDAANIFIGCVQQMQQMLH